MALRKFWSIAYRDLVRNRRRTVLTLIAVALGLMVILLMSTLFAGVIDGGIRDNIRLSTGHLQVRAESYDADKLSLQFQDLMQDGESLAAQIEGLEIVQSASPVLWTSGILSTVRESTGLRVSGLNPTDGFHEAIRDGVVSGELITADSRGEIMLGRRLADDMEITAGQRVSLALGSSEGQPEEGVFTVAGLFDTGIPSFDQNTVVMPLAQAQSFTRTGDRVSSIIVMLGDRDDTAAAAAAIQGPGLQVLTWEVLNAVLLETAQAGVGVYYAIYVIVMLVVAVLIANTLLMSVFERTREMGILAALGMNGRQIMTMFLFEAIILAIMGIIIGVLLGAIASVYMVNVGISIPADTAALVEGMSFGTTMYGQYAPGEAAVLSLLMLIIVVVVSIYPAWYAGRLEPVAALQAQ